MFLLRCYGECSCFCFFKCFNICSWCTLVCTLCVQFVSAVLSLQQFVAHRLNYWCIWGPTKVCLHHWTYAAVWISACCALFHIQQHLCASFSRASVALYKYCCTTCLHALLPHMSSACLSVCLSVTLVDQDHIHIGWKMDILDTNCTDSVGDKGQWAFPGTAQCFKVPLYHLRNV